MTETIGVVGVGNMGSEFARNLLGAKYDVVVYDIDQTQVQRMEDAGARARETGSAVAHEASIVITSLPTAEAIESAYLAADGIIEGAQPGTLLIEMSTTKPKVSETVHAAAVETDVEYVDAPVIGIPPVAAAAELVIMVGGSESAFDRAKPVLETLGREIHHMGGVGDGHRSKLLNNMVLLTEYAIAAEAFALANVVGVDQDKLFEIITNGMAGSEIIEAKASKAFSGNFDPADGSPANNARKDLWYALDMGYEAGFLMPVTAATEEHYSLASTVGRGEEDYSVLLRVLEDLADRQ